MFASEGRSAVDDIVSEKIPADAIRLILDATNDLLSQCHLYLGLYYAAAYLPGAFSVTSGRHAVSQRHESVVCPHHDGLMPVRGFPVGIIRGKLQEAINRFWPGQQSEVYSVLHLGQGIWVNWEPSWHPLESDQTL